MPIEQVSQKVKKVRSTLKKYQSGEIKILKTGREQIDATLGGLLPGDIVTIAGASGAGKSFELQTIRENIMSTDINPNADNYVFLDYSFEMKLFNLVLRGLHKNINKSKKDILLTQFEEDEKPLANRYMETLIDPRFFIEENPLNPEVFYTQSREFLNEHKDKEAVIIAIDHMALFKNSENREKKGTVDAAVESINLLKREFSNVYFVILTQLNRSILARIADKDLNACPNRADIYQSDTMYHISDYLIVVHNPYRLGINEYLRVVPEHYRYLDYFFAPSEGVSKRVSFRTLGMIFYHVLKIREGDIVFKDIFIEEIENENLEMYKKELIDVNKDEEDGGFDNLDFDDDKEDHKF